MPSELLLKFDCGTQSLDALKAATYRMIGTASCQIERVQDRWICVLKPSSKEAFDGDILHTHFLNLVADENMRESIASKTEPVRNLILALAFGSLASGDRSK